MNKKPTLLLALCLVLFHFAPGQTTGTFTDPRDGQTYKTITFEREGKEYTWFAQNLNYKREGSFVPENMNDYRSEYGSYYTWEAAKMACPNGWHLPSDEEWSILVNKFGGTNDAGKALKSDKGWNNNGNGTNSSGFNALPAGYRYTDGSYNFLGKFGYWWSASPDGEGGAWRWGLFYDISGALYVRFNVSIGLSVRCVQD